MSDGDQHEPSFWRELADGRAGWGVRLFLSIMLAPVLIGVSLVFIYLIAAANKDPRGYIRVDDELVGAAMGVNFGLWLLGVIWLWSRGSSPAKRVAWNGALGTIGTALVVIPVCMWLEEALQGDQEIIIVGVVFLGIANAMMLWFVSWRRYGRGRRVFHRQDRKLDVRCPKCDYRMVGLSESRCPECGAQFTLDELLAAQHFRRDDAPPPRPTSHAPPPPLPRGDAATESGAP